LSLDVNSSSTAPKPKKKCWLSFFDSYIPSF
jgi:hypothetical protein